MPSPIKSLPVYLLSLVLFLGAISRFSHGNFAPWWYAFQVYHAPDDGSTVAIITPYLDFLFGATLLFGRRSLRISAAVVSLSFFAIGLAMQVAAGKTFMGDIALVAVGVAGVWGC